MQATERAKQMDTLRDKASDLLTQVTDETLTLDEAWGAYRIRYEKEIAAEQADLERRRDQATALARCLSTLGTITVPESRDRISAPPSRLLYTYDTARVRRAGITGL